MAKHDWISDLIQTNVYDGEGRTRRVSLHKVYNLASINDGGGTVVKLARAEEDGTLTPGRAVATVSCLLRGVARRNGGVYVQSPTGGIEYKPAPQEWLAHYGLTVA